MRKFRLYAELRDMRKMGRIRAELGAQGKDFMKEAKVPRSPRRRKSTAAGCEVSDSPGRKNIEEQKQHARISLIALKDWRRTAAEQRLGDEVVADIDEAIVP